MRFGFVFLLLICSGSLIDAAERPNVVMIISDDQAWGDYSFMGHEQIETPHLDRLAEQSLTFTRGYVPNSLCRPSLATIVSGLYPHQHRISGNDPKGPKGASDYVKRRYELQKHIKRIPTLAKILGKEGYLSHQSGKWWEGSYQLGGFTHGMTHGDFTRGGRHGDEGLQIGRNGMQPVFDFMGMAKEQQKPFFVYYAPFLPHTPHNPPARLLNKYKEKTPHLPIAKYWAMCEWFDETCGELLTYLDKQELAENTIVVYVTDNGWINEQKSSRYAPRSKRSPNEGGIRTPIMVRWPGKVAPKLDEKNLASSIDLVPTILAAMDLPTTEEMEGINLLDADAVSKRSAIFGEIFAHDIEDIDEPAESLRYRWVIDGPWKLIVPNPATESQAKVQLYQLLQDPHEKQELSTKHPEIVDRLSQQINGWWATE